MSKNENSVELNLEELRAQATELGLKPHHRANAGTVQKMIEDHLAEQQKKVTVSAHTSDSFGDTDTEDKAEGGSEDPEENTDPRLKEKVVPLTREEYLEQDAKERRKHAGRLIRCRVTCMNPEKKNWQGEIISVGSAKLGTFKKFVAFNTPDGYHIPQIIYDMMKERKCTIFVDSRDARGRQIKQGKLIPEFNIEVLPPLTPDELSDLAKRQALAAGQA